MLLKVLTTALCICFLATGAFADSRYRMIAAGNFDLSFVDEAIAKDTTGRLEMVEMYAVPGQESGPEIIALLERDWTSAAALFERRNDLQMWSSMEPAPNPALIVRRTDYMREDGKTVRVYVFVSYAQNKPVPRECQATLIASDFASTEPLSTVTLARCFDGLS